MSRFKQPVKELLTMRTVDPLDVATIPGKTVKAEVPRQQMTMVALERTDSGATHWAIPCNPVSMIALADVIVYGGRHYVRVLNSDDRYTEATVEYLPLRESHG